MKKIQHELLRSIGERLETFGFKSRAVGQSFQRSIEGGRQSIHVAFVTHASDFDVTSDVAVRFDAVEDLVNGSVSYLSSREKAQTYTAGAQIGAIAKIASLRHTVTCSSDIPDVSNQLVLELTAWGLPYLESVSTLERLFRLLGQEGKESWLYHPIHLARGIRVLAIAYLLNRTSEIDSIVDRYRQVLTTLDVPSARGFEIFAEQILRLVNSER